MMRLFLFLCLGVFGAHASISLETIRTWYENGDYNKVCSHEVTAIYEKYTDDEEFVNMYRHSCVEIDIISRVTNPINKLVRSPQTRANAVYFATVLYQKKLLYHAFVDDVDISYIRLPRTEHILSTIFDNYVIGNFTKENDEFIFIDGEKSHRLKVEKSSDNLFKMIIKTYENEKLVQTRAFW